MLVTCIFIALSSFSNAIMDHIASYNTFESFFIRRKMVNLSIWFSSNSWKNKYEIAEWLNAQFNIPINITTAISKQILVIVSDAWHFFKVVMLISFAYACVNADFSYITKYINDYDSSYDWLLIWLLYSILFSMFHKSFKFLK